MSETDKTSRDQSPTRMDWLVVQGQVERGNLALASLVALSCAMDYQIESELKGIDNDRRIGSFMGAAQVLATLSTSGNMRS